MTQRPEAPPRLPALDGVRGLAVALVFAYHAALYCRAATGGWLERTYYRVAGAGWTGVDFFFVLSGFLITGILIESRGRGRYFSAFYARRVLRILPLYYAVLFVAFVGLRPWHAASLSLQWFANRQWWFWSYLQNWLIACEVGPRPFWLSHFWSLAIEEQFYLAWPLIVWALGRRSLVSLCAGLVALSLALRVGLRLMAPADTVDAYFTTPARLDGLAVGALLALLHRDPASRALCAALALPALAGAVLGLLVVMRLGGLGMVPTTTVDILAFSLLYGAVINAAVLRPGWPWVRLVASQPIRALGKVSYGFYVFHVPVLIVLAPHFSLLSGVPFDLPLVRQAALFTTAGALTLVLAQMSWGLFERHFLALKQRFEPGSRPSTPRTTR